MAASRPRTKAQSVIVEPRNQPDQRIEADVDPRARNANRRIQNPGQEFGSNSERFNPRIMLRIIRARRPYGLTGLASRVVVHHLPPH